MAQSSSRPFVTLSDGRLGLRGGLQIQCREPRPGDGIGADDTSGAVLDFISSNEALDRYDEIILADGWRLENYRRNPVFQNAHQYGDILHTIGRALITEVRNTAAPVLFQRIQFAVEANPLARIAYGLYQGGFLNAVSVGFIPIRWENGGAQDGFRRKYLEQELLEVSAVGIPANPDALQLGLKAGAIQRSDLLEACERARHLLATTAAGPVPDRGAVPPASPESATAALTLSWQELVRVLRHVLRRG